MNSALRGVRVASLLALAGCATQTNMTNTQRDVEELKTRLLQVDRDVSGLRSATREDLDKTLKAYQKDLENLRKSAADLQATIDSTKVDTQVVTGKIDDVAVMAKKATEETGLLREDLERRLKAVDERMTKVEKGFDDLQKKMAEAKPKEPELTPDALYQKALDTFRAGDAAKARELFTRFLDQNPQSDLAANAHYWLGETYYAEKNYDQAILEFQQLIKNYPKRDKVPAAMLKQAMAFKELGDVRSARYVLKKLQEEYPSTEEAQKAKERLKEMK